jgi:hypothetical protein
LTIRDLEEILPESVVGWLADQKCVEAAGLRVLPIGVKSCFEITIEREYANSFRSLLRILLRELVRGGLNGKIVVAARFPESTNYFCAR